MNRFASPSTIAHFQSGWLTEVFRGKVELPSKAEMLVHYFLTRIFFGNGWSQLEFLSLLQADTAREMKRKVEEAGLAPRHFHRLERYQVI